MFMVLALDWSCLHVSVSETFHIFSLSACNSIQNDIFNIDLEIQINFFAREFSISLRQHRTLPIFNIIRIFSGALAELIPHLALFISLVGAFAGSSLALMFPPLLDLLVGYAKRELSLGVWAKNIFLFLFALIGLTTGTYASVVEIVKAFGRDDPV